MQDIIASLPESVLNYKDINDRTIIDWDFNPFAGFDKISTDIIRPHYVMNTIECNGEKITVATKVEGNIQEAIDNKIEAIYITDPYLKYINSFEDDVYKLLDAGHIRCMMIDGYDLKSNGKQYHVDFLFHDIIEDNITSYYSYGRETSKTVVLRDPVGPITNNLISLGGRFDKGEYPDTITSKFIGNTNYYSDDQETSKTVVPRDPIDNTNVRSNHQEILDMLAALKAKIEAL